jgi:hypothetical protein
VTLLCNILRGRESGRKTRKQGAEERKQRRERRAECQWEVWREMSAFVFVNLSFCEDFIKTFILSYNGPLLFGLLPSYPLFNPFLGGGFVLRSCVCGVASQQYIFSFLLTVLDAKRCKWLEPGLLQC